jgi:hypothetical protein
MMAGPTLSLGIDPSLLQFLGNAAAQAKAAKAEVKEVEAAMKQLASSGQAISPELMGRLEAAKRGQAEAKQLITEQRSAMRGLGDAKEAMEKLRGLIGLQAVRKLFSGEKIEWGDVRTAAMFMDRPLQKAAERLLPGMAGAYVGRAAKAIPILAVAWEAGEKAVQNIKRASEARIQVNRGELYETLSKAQIEFFRKQDPDTLWSNIFGGDAGRALQDLVKTGREFAQYKAQVKDLAPLLSARYGRKGGAAMLEEFEADPHKLFIEGKKIIFDKAAQGLIDWIGQQESKTDFWEALFPILGVQRQARGDDQQTQAVLHTLVTANFAKLVAEAEQREQQRLRRKLRPDERAQITEEVLTEFIAKMPKEIGEEFRKQIDEELQKAKEERQEEGRKRKTVFEEWEDLEKERAKTAKNFTEKFNDNERRHVDELTFQTRRYRMAITGHIGD